MKHKNSFKVSFYSALACVGLSVPAYSSNPVSNYIINGKSVANWQMSVGNALNYYVPIEAQSGKTKRKNLTVSPSKKETDGDALRLKWKGKKVKNQWGGNALNNNFFSVGKHNIDISSVKDAAALAFEIKVLKAPNEQVTLSMQCNHSNKCVGSYALKSSLRSLPKNKWTVLPIPLNCFKGDNEFDFSQVTNILNIATQGKLDIEIANVALIQLPAGSKGCA